MCPRLKNKKFSRDALLSISHFPGPCPRGSRRNPDFSLDRWRICHSHQEWAEQMSQVPYHYNVTMWPFHPDNVTMLSFCHRDHFAMLHCINDNVSAQCAIASFLSKCDDVTTRRRRVSNSLFSAIFPKCTCASRVNLSQLIHQNPYIVHDAVQHRKL